MKAKRNFFIHNLNLKEKNSQHFLEFNDEKWKFFVFCGRSKRFKISEEFVNFQSRRVAKYLIF